MTIFDRLDRMKSDHTLRFYASLGRSPIRHAALHHLECPDFHPFPAAQNLFLELRMVLALPFALYSNEEKGEPRFWHLMK
ncbi:hypothetical protein HFO60_00085 [Rhizobium leguminosarum]|uniref:hypothetical protein n=1 Tax=Rhizobium leguminosarum TaxID=384 RepID=UPI001C94E3CC|nr:hypothetical protein [Rhizobium leguminosarum]MBY5538486.1 hypothetical protein [Rhizobium leguminosarum]